MTSVPSLLRSVLYVPASNARAVAKAVTLDCDAVILDLEDAVAPDSKAEARAGAVAAIKAGDFDGRELVVRINALDTPWGRDDLEALVEAGAPAILAPKIGDAADLQTLHLLTAGAERPPALWAMIETCRSILSLPEIAASARDPGSRLTCLIAGTNDLLKELRALPTSDRLGLVGLLTSMVATARSASIAVIDGVFNDISNEAGFEVECRQGRALGFDGKTLVHPGQILPCNSVFSPSPEAIAEAQAIRLAFDQPENADKGVIRLDGRMVERLHLQIALSILAQVDLIAHRKREQPSEKL